MGSRRGVQFAQLPAKFAVVVDPEVQVVHGSLRRLDVGEVEQCQLRLPVGTDFEFFQMSWFWVKQKINDINLRRLLLGRGMMLEQRADVDREEVMTGGLPGDLLPVGEGLAVGIGVGEENHVSVAERPQLLRIQHR